MLDSLEFIVKINTVFVLIHHSWIRTIYVENLEKGSCNNFLKINIPENELFF